MQVCTRTIAARSRCRIRAIQLTNSSAAANQGITTVAEVSNFIVEVIFGARRRGWFDSAEGDGTRLPALNSCKVASSA